MKAPRPLIATPCGDTVKVNYMTSLARLNPTVAGPYRSSHGALPDLLTLSCSLITIGRTGCMLRFLEGDWSHLFFIDSDVGFAPENFRRVLLSGFDICAAPYPYRKATLGYPVDPKWVGPVDELGYAPCLYVPTGFTCVKREVFEKLLEAGFGKTEIFDTYRDIETDEYFSEDIAFCMRCREIGIDIRIDTRASLTHMGSMEFHDSFEHYIKGNSQQCLENEKTTNNQMELNLS